MVIGMASKTGCDDPCGVCGGDACDVCDDIAGARSVVMTLSDITTVSPVGACPACEDHATPTELAAIDLNTTLTRLAVFTSGGCSTDADRVEGTECGYLATFTCGALYYLERFAMTYRTTGGDLRMFVGVRSDWSDGMGTCSGSSVGSDDFELASGAFTFNCLDLDHDGTIGVCSGTVPLCACSFPAAYNVTMISA
jgi:bacterioferritin-associated ferredoxin